MPSDPPVFDEFKLPFIFVPHGTPESTEWLQRHPDYIKLPATMVPRARNGGRSTPSPPNPSFGEHRTIDGLAASAGQAAPGPLTGNAVPGAGLAGTNEASDRTWILDDPIAAFRRANDALATAASDHVSGYRQGQAGSATSDMRPVDDQIQQEPLARPPIQQAPLAPPPGRAFPSAAIEDSHSSPGELLPFLRADFVPGTKDVIEFGTDGLIHDPTMEKIPPEIGLPRLTDIDI